MPRKAIMPLSVGRAFISSIFFWLCTSGLIVVSAWSFSQTQKFIESGNTGDISFWLSLTIQYSQNIFLFLIPFLTGYIEINPTLKISQRNLLFFGFFVSAFIDAGTNIGQYRASFPDVARNLSVVSITWYSICIACVMVEELLGYSLSAALHSSNDFFEALGFNRNRALDFVPNWGEKKPKERKINNPFISYEPTNSALNPKLNYLHPNTKDYPEFSPRGGMEGLSEQYYQQREKKDRKNG